MLQIYINDFKTIFFVNSQQDKEINLVLDFHRVKYTFEFFLFARHWPHKP